MVPATWVSLVRESSSAFLLKTRCLWKHSSSTDNERHVMVLSREVIRSLKTPATLYLIHTRVSPSPMANHLKFMQMNTRSLEVNYGSLTTQILDGSSWAQTSFHSSSDFGFWEIQRLNHSCCLHSQIRKTSLEVWLHCKLVSLALIHTGI